MVNVKTFVFNPFQENTYLLFDESRECIIIDPGCYEEHEKTELSNFMLEHRLTPVKIYNTHCHIDHVLGNQYLAEKYKIGIALHQGGLQFLKTASQSAALFGLQLDGIVTPTDYLEDGDIIVFGKSKLEVLYTPGHAEGSICFYSREGQFVIAGDVLFKGSIGRTDLPSGDYELLINSIRIKLLTLPDSTTVYPGHGPATTIGDEKLFNPFLS